MFSVHFVHVSFYISAFFTVICRFVRIGAYIAFICLHLPTHIEMLSPGVQCFFGFVWLYFLYGWVSCQPDRTMLKKRTEFKELTSHRNHVSLISRRWINPLHRNSIYTMKQVSWPCSVTIVYMNLLLYKKSDSALTWFINCVIQPRVCISRFYWFVFSSHVVIIRGNRMHFMHTLHFRIFYQVHCGLRWYIVLGAIVLPYQRSSFWMHLVKFWNFECIHVPNLYGISHVSWVPSLETAYPYIGSKQILCEKN